jgi:hypothetical protein
MPTAPQVLLDYHTAGGPTICDLDVQPWICEFWPLDELEQSNLDCEVQTYAPGFYGFATSGGGEMFALAPDGSVVCLAFIGMSPKEQLPVAPNWQAFVGMLRVAA